MLKFIAVSDFRCDYEKSDDSCITERDAKKLDAVTCAVTKSSRFIADLGDSLNEELSPENATELFRSLFYAYDKTVDIYSVCGERDLALLKENYLTLNEYSMRYRAFDRSDYRCIFLDCCVYDENGVHFEIDDEQIMWLSRLLGKTHRPAIIFTHAPIAVSNPEDESKIVKNAAAVRKLCETSKKVSLVVSGHLDHGDFVVSENVPYLTLSPMYDGDDATFAEIIVSSRGVEIKGHGKQESYSVIKPHAKEPKPTFFSKLKNFFKRKKEL